MFEYGEEKVQTPNSLACFKGAVKAVVGKNQQVVGSSPSAGSIWLGASWLDLSDPSISVCLVGRCLLCEVWQLCRKNLKH